MEGYWQCGVLRLSLSDKIWCWFELLLMRDVGNEVDMARIMQSVLVLHDSYAQQSEVRCSGSSGAGNADGVRVTPVQIIRTLREARIRRVRRLMVVRFGGVGGRFGCRLCWVCCWRCCCWEGRWLWGRSRTGSICGTLCIVRKQMCSIGV